MSGKEKVKLQMTTDVQPSDDVGAAVSGGKIAVVTVGKFQGPHFGHRVLIQKVASTAAEVGGEPFVFTTTSRDIISKPHFKIKEKLEIMRKMFGNIINPANIKEGSIGSVFALAKEGYNTIYILAGSDRLKTATDCERDSRTDIQKLKTCWKNSFFNSVVFLQHSFNRLFVVFLVIYSILC